MSNDTIQTLTINELASMSKLIAMLASISDSQPKPLKQASDDRVDEVAGEEIPGLQIGKAYFIRTVTFSFLGEVECVRGGFIKLKTSSWIADTGRFSDFMKNGVTSSTEIEPYLNGNEVALSSLIDFAEWVHPLPTEQK